MSTGVWNPSDIPSQNGKSIIITGSTSGIGLETAKELARAGGNITLAARNPEKAKAVIQELEKETGNKNIEFMPVDTSSLDSVRNFAAAWEERGKKVDVLILNAGISNVPKREESVDGYERQFATNYLGHFLMTALMLPFIRNEEGSRIVLVASLAHKRTMLHLDDLQLHNYSPMTAYAQSKLAVLTFGLELSKRLDEAGIKIAAIPVHPGVASTEITRGGDRNNPVVQKIAKTIFGLLGQKPAEGAWPALYAATSPEANNGKYYGPSGKGERKGVPGIAGFEEYANDREIASRLWTISEDLVGQKFEIK